MTRWQLALLAAILVAAAGLGAWAWFVTPSEKRTGSQATEERLIPNNRKRSVVQVRDCRYSPPDPATRRRFDGRWYGVSDVGNVSVVLLDGVGDLIINSGDTRKAGRFEILQYFDDDLIDIGVWLGEDKDWLWIASCSSESDWIRIDGLLAPGPEGLPNKLFVLHRERFVGGGTVDFRALSKAHPVHPPWPADPAPPKRAEPESEPVPKPGRYLLLLTMDQGLLGVLDEQQVFRGERLYSIGTAYSGAPILKRRHVKEIIWPDGVDPAKYPAKKK